MNITSKTGTCFFLLLSSSLLFAQTEKLNQFWNESIFKKSLSEKWMLQMDIGLTSSSVPDDSNIFYGITQVYIRGWGHYYLSDRWKLSAFYAYYINRNVPELEQDKTNEFRSAIQGTYNLFKGRNKVNLRARIEDRHLESGTTYFEAVQRLRLQIKSTCPINGPVIEKGVLYAFASEEVYFKTKSQISGPDYFDRNRFIAGFGYAFSNDLQAEVSYANDYLPRDGYDKVFNAVQVIIVFNNFLPNLARSFQHKKKAVDDGSSGM